MRIVKLLYSFGAEGWRVFPNTCPVRSLGSGNRRLLGEPRQEGIRDSVEIGHVIALGIHEGGYGIRVTVVGIQWLY